MLLFSSRPELYRSRLMFTVFRNAVKTAVWQYQNRMICSLGQSVVQSKSACEHDSYSAALKWKYVKQ